MMKQSMGTKSHWLSPYLLSRGFFGVIWLEMEPKYALLSVRGV